MAVLVDLGNPSVAMQTSAPGIFLTAQWHQLAMLNYDVAPEVLAEFVPPGTELDTWRGRTFVSVVGFLFLRTRVLGVPIPFHRDFEEVNLRFYVRRRAPEGWRRGVVFIKEIVPRPVIAWVARTIYHEPYVAFPMAHRLESESGVVRGVEYSWQCAGHTQRLRVRTCGTPQPLVAGSDAEFITEHYWGYNASPDGSTLEYQVAHPRWRVQEVSEARLDCDVAALYGSRFCASLSGRPASAFLAEGSAVTVYRGIRLPT